MKQTYDLIVVGSSEKSISTAEYAAQLGARVSLILPLSDYISSFIDLYKSSYLTSEFHLSYGDLLQEKKYVLQDHTIHQLQKIGVDVIDSPFQFLKDKKIRLKTEKDELFAPACLLNLEKSRLFVADFNQINLPTNCIAIADLILQDQWNALPENIAVLGNDLTAIYLMQKLIKMGKQISLFTANQSVLPHEDIDIAWQLQLHLEAQGGTIYSNDQFHPERLSSVSNEYEKVIITDIGNYQVRDNLELEKLGIKIGTQRIRVNNKLQTDNHRIYCCGGILGGYNLDHLWEYEAQIATENALFFPVQQVNYYQLPYCLATNPPVYRLGYTEAQAKFLFGQTITVINLSCDYHFFGIAYLKLILDRHNHIIGFHSLGYNEEIATAINLVLKNNQPVKYLFQLSFCNFRNWQLIKYIKQQLQQKKQKNNDIIMSLRETFFIWKNH